MAKIKLDINQKKDSYIANPYPCCVAVQKIRLGGRVSSVLAIGGGANNGVVKLFSLPELTLLQTLPPSKNWALSYLKGPDFHLISTLEGEIVCFRDDDLRAGIITPSKLARDFLTETFFFNHSYWLHSKGMCLYNNNLYFLNENKTLKRISDVGKVINKEIEADEEEILEEVDAFDAEDRKGVVAVTSDGEIRILGTSKKETVIQNATQEVCTCIKWLPDNYIIAAIKRLDNNLSFVLFNHKLERQDSQTIHSDNREDFVLTISPIEMKKISMFFACNHKGFYMLIGAHRGRLTMIDNGQVDILGFGYSYGAAFDAINHTLYQPVPGCLWSFRLQGI